MALEQTPQNAVGAGGQPSWIAPIKPVVPDHELLVRIGGGSYGDVWLARSVVGTWRAVKVVFRDRFLDAKPYERELSGIQKFEPLSRSNEGFIDILQIGRNDAEGYFYYVMELADDASGASQIRPETYVPKTLAKALLERGRLPVSDCLELGVTLNLGLAKLHEAGLIHRDIKPSNIIFVGGVPKLADIGLVIEYAEARSYVGTEGFIPPEGPNSPQADIYSLGKVLYEAGMGKDRKDFPEPLTLIGQAPDSTELLEFNAILLRACAANVQDRYQSAGEMNADLALLQSGGSVRRQRKLMGQLRLARRVGATISVLLGVIGLGWLWQARETHLVRKLAADKATLLIERTELAQTNRERLVRLNVANGVRELDQGDVGSALVWLSQALELTTNNAADANVQRGRIHHLLSQHPRLLHVFPHPGGVRWADFSPDEQRVVTACMDGSVRIWDTRQDGQPVGEFHLGSPVEFVRFTHDGKRLLALERDPLRQSIRASVLDAQTGKPLFPPLQDATCACFSYDDRWLAVATTNSAMQLVSVEMGRVVAEAKGHEGWIEMISFSLDSTEILTASRDHTARRWDVATGAMIGPPLRHSQAVSRAVFNRDGTRIATATAAEAKGTAIQFQVWDSITGTTVGQSIPGDGACTVLSFDPSGQKFMTGDSDGAFVIRDAESHATAAPQLQIDSPAHVVTFTPDGALLAIGSERGNARIWDLETGLPRSSLLHHAGRVEHLCFNADGSRLLTASEDGSVKCWELAQMPDDSYLSLKAFEHANGEISPDGRQLLLKVLDGRRRLQLVNLNPLKVAVLSLPAADEVNAGLITFDHSGNQWAVGCGPSPYDLEFSQNWRANIGAGLWRHEGDQIRHWTLPYSGLVRGVFFDERGNQLLTVCGDRRTRIWNAADASLLQIIPWPKEDLAWVTISPDLRTVVALRRDAQGRHFVLHEVETGKLLGSSPQTNPDINFAAFSADGRRVASVGDNQCGRIWDALTGEPVTPDFKHGGVLTTLGWSPDGRRVITAGQSPEVKVWDAATGSLALRPLRMKAKKLKGSKFSADGRFIVAWSEDKFVRVWDAVTGEAVTPLLPHWDHILAAFVTSNSLLVTVSGPCVVRTWDLSPSPNPIEDLANYARLLAGGSVQDPGWSRALPADELAALLRSLRLRQPQFFATSKERLTAWHRRQLAEPLTPTAARTSIFHLEQLARLVPDDITVAEELDRCRATLIPVRDPQTPPRLLDLTRAYTHSLEQQRFGDFAELPRGRQVLGGTEYDLRGFIELDHRAEWIDYSGPFHPMAAIEFGHRCRHLHFLQATEGDPNLDGSTVATWSIHYSDGSTQEWPVIYGDHVRSLSKLADAAQEARSAKIVWQGRRPSGDLPSPNGTARLYESIWTNPKPELEITQLEFRIGQTALKPLVVAITAD